MQHKKENICISKLAPISTMMPLLFHIRFGFLYFFPGFFVLL